MFRIGRKCYEFEGTESDVVDDVDKGIEGQANYHRGCSIFSFLR
ncbi:MAG: hypothetical protein ACTSXX_02475 [Candidatus Baldrarchaeia archaeon]